MSDTPTASPVVLGRWERPGNLAAIAALAAAGQVTILPHELIRTTDGRVYHWTGTALEVVSAPVHHGTVADVAALAGIYLLPSCTRGVHLGDTAYVTAAGCEYRVASGVNATATWAACASIPSSASAIGADPAGSADAAVSTHNTAPDAHADIRTALAGKQDAGSFAGSSTPGGAATTALACTGNAATATTAASCTGNSATATTASSCSGNAATATALATARLINGTSFNGSSDVIVSKIYDANYTRIQNPGGGVYTTTTEVISGAIAVQFPVSMIDSMMRLTIKVYEYTTGESFECVICGYMYANNSTGNTWSYSPTAYIIGNPNTDRGFNIRYGYNSSIDKAVVYIGELNSAWSYPQVYVTDVQIGFGGFSSSWLTGWQIGFEATAFENVTATVTDCQVGYRPANAFTGAKVIGDTTLNFVNGLLVS